MIQAHEQSIKLETICTKHFVILLLNKKY